MVEWCVLVFICVNWQRCVYLESINRRGLSSLFEANPRSVVQITVQWEQELTLGELLQTLQEMSTAAEHFRSR